MVLYEWVNNGKLMIVKVSVLVNREKFIFYCNMKIRYLNKLIIIDGNDERILIVNCRVLVSWFCGVYLFR